MISRYRWILFGLLTLGLSACPACRARQAPLSQPAEGLPIHPDTESVSELPEGAARLVASLEYWLPASCPGKWSYYVAREDPSAVLTWYHTKLEMTGWEDAVAEEKQLPEIARLPNWGVWHNQSRMVILVARPVTIAPENTAEEPEEGTLLALRQCDYSTSR